jgi:IS30 family transposase
MQIRVPKELTVDNGKQFDSDLFKEFCHSIGTKVMFASVYHPQSNGAVERANGLILSSIKNAYSIRRKANRQTNSRRSYGLITPLSPEQPNSPHSDSYTKLKQ